MASLVIYIYIHIYISSCPARPRRITVNYCVIYYIHTVFHHVHDRSLSILWQTRYCLGLRYGDYSSVWYVLVLKERKMYGNWSRIHVSFDRRWQLVI